MEKAVVGEVLFVDYHVEYPNPTEHAAAIVRTPAKLATGPAVRPATAEHK